MGQKIIPVIRNVIEHILIRFSFEHIRVDLILLKFIMCNLKIVHN